MIERLLLLIDAGNSSIKWKLISDQEKKLLEIAQTPADHLNNEQVSAQALCMAWQAAIHARSADPALSTQHLTVAWLCVGPLAVQTAVAQAFMALTGDKASNPYQAQALIQLNLSFPESSSHQTVTLNNRYDDPGQLGADRWVAALGLAALGICKSGDQLLVISAGTATTADLITCLGPHDLIFQGGWIIPGARLMHQSLFKNTRGLSYEWQEHESEFDAVPRASPQAIQQGIAFAQVGWVEGLVRRHQIKMIVLSGGNAAFWKTALQHTGLDQITLLELPGLSFAGLAALATNQTAG